MADTIELPKFHHFMDYLYFPHPGGTLIDQPLELHLAAKGLEEEVFVKFLVD